MTSIQRAYDAVAQQYACLFLDELDRDPQTRRCWSALADMWFPGSGPVADLGCGPGAGVEFLRGLGIDAVGIDVSTGQLAEARRSFADLPLAAGDLALLAVRPRSLGGIVARFSIIHLAPDSLPGVFAEWRRALGAGAPVALSFFGSVRAEAHGTPFDHQVATAFELHPTSVEQQLTSSGFDLMSSEVGPLVGSDRPYGHVTIVARTPLT